MGRRLSQVSKDVESWIQFSQRPFYDRYVEDDQLWVLKFFSPQYLAGFMRRPELVISSTPGFTWGDGVYVVSLEHAYSAMIYGRVGVMGWIDTVELRRVYDAADPKGLSLYQEWIQFKPGLFRLLTTTVHSQFANRRLRNAFCKRFDIDLIIFSPDEFNRAYVRPGADRWCVVSDFPATAPLPAGTPGFSQKIRECELVAIGTEEFAIDRSGFVRQDLIGFQVARGQRTGGSTSFVTDLRKTYQYNRTRGTNPPLFILAKP